MCSLHPETTTASESGSRTELCRRDMVVNIADEKQMGTMASTRRCCKYLFLLICVILISCASSFLFIEYYYRFSPLETGLKNVGCRYCDVEDVNVDADRNVKCCEKKENDSVVPVSIKKKKKLAYEMSLDVRKRTVWCMRQTKAQISLRIRAVWSESSLSAWRNFESLAIQIALKEDSDQTARMRRLIWIFGGRTRPKVRFGSNHGQVTILNKW